MPYVRDRLRKHFGMLVRDDVDPANAVAAGAALLGQSVERGLPAVSLQSVLPMTIGLASVVDPTFRPLITRNTPLPVRHKFDVAVQRAHWKTFGYDVFQGDSNDIEENEYLGTLEVFDLDPGHLDTVPLAIEFELTKECLLKVYVTNGATGTRTEMLLSNKPVAPAVSAKKNQTQPPA
jgi:molecular chaperone DnaK (HSP70)